jgi:hypothetical protein
VPSVNSLPRYKAKEPSPTLSFIRRQSTLHQPLPHLIAKHPASTPPSLQGKAPLPHWQTCMWRPLPHLTESHTGCHQTSPLTKANMLATASLTTKRQMVPSTVSSPICTNDEPPPNTPVVATRQPAGQGLPLMANSTRHLWYPSPHATTR